MCHTHSTAVVHTWHVYGIDCFNNKDLTSITKRERIVREALWRIRLGFTSLGASAESEDGGWERRRELVNFFLSITPFLVRREK